ncbi:hypothetical protein F5Y11DRAFT_316163 [Daldinia sp. FL1419]|nr:hypothetical protein F5Y11DRAFT_316163 [Daldinia sp. FL1419]
MKLLISSREEREIALRLKSKFIPLRFDYKNSQDINSFVHLGCESMVDEKKSCGVDEHTCIITKETLEAIVCTIL